MAMSGAVTDTDADRLRFGEAVAVFDNVESFQSAIDELQEHGFDRSALGTVASRRTVERLRGRFYDDVTEIEDDETVPHAPFISRTSLGDAEGMAIAVPVYVFAVIAASIAAAGGAETGAVVLTVVIAGLIGGGVGYLGARFIERRWRNRIAEQLERGGLVLWVALHDPDEEARAKRILAEHGGRHVHVHTVKLPDYSGEDPDLDLVRIRHRRPTAWWNP